MKRAYTLKRRAEQQADTHRRLVEAAVDLHSRIGPAGTTFSMIAERAGVQRHTLYAHFPDERTLLLACSGLAAERDPLPDIEAWRNLPPGDRLPAALATLYAWYGRNADLMGCVLRDSEHHAPTREVVELRMVPLFTAFSDAVTAGLTASQKAMATVALSFYTWRSLSRDAGLDHAAAVAAMVRAVLSA